MGISRDSIHKRRLTGGKRKTHPKKKRKFNLARQPAMTKIGAKRIHSVRVRGGNIKYRALRLDSGNFSWGTEAITRKCRILGVVYNSTNNELVRTNTLVKNCVVQIDATPFRQWYEQHYGVALGGKKKKTDKKKEGEEKKETKHSKHVLAKLKHRQEDRDLEATLEEQLISGRIYACVSSRPGQSGRCDGYLVEGKELEFYSKKLSKKKEKKTV